MRTKKLGTRLIMRKLWVQTLLCCLWHCCWWLLLLLLCWCASYPGIFIALSIIIFIIIIIAIITIVVFALTVIFTVSVWLVGGGGGGGWLRRIVLLQRGLPFFILLQWWCRRLGRVGVEVFANKKSHNRLRWVLVAVQQCLYISLYGSYNHRCTHIVSMQK